MRADGRVATVSDILADVELIKVGKNPKSLNIGLSKTKFQEIIDERKPVKNCGKNATADLQVLSRAVARQQMVRERELAAY